MSKSNLRIIGTDSNVTEGGHRTERWQLGFRSLEDEVVEELELKTEGTVPADLAGTLFRIGPARHEVNGKRNAYWFEGDGMVHALRVENGRVFYRNRFLVTAKRREDEAMAEAGQQRFTPATLGRQLRRVRQPWKLFNPANTNVVVHNGELLALCEIGRPYRVDLSSLETVGEDDFGVIPPTETYIAHGKLDPSTGELWNIGFKLGLPPVRVTLYRRDATGRTTVVARHPMPLPTIAHDIALTPTKVVVVACPWTPSRFPIGLILGQGALLDHLRWQPKLGTRIMVFDRTNGDARVYDTRPFMLHHTVNAFDDGDDVVLDLCPHPDITITTHIFQDLLTGTWPAVNQSWPERIRLRADGRVDHRRLADIPFEFPRVAPRSWLTEHRWVYGLSGYLGGPVALDTETGTVTSLPHGNDEYAGEPVPVPKPGARSDTDVWLLTVVLSETNDSELRIFDGNDLGAPPVARVLLPHVMPFDFHGSWLPAGATMTIP
jgi:all-trans-8'-apo-beta-carotenal 15,15'-oxygenase